MFSLTDKTTKTAHREMTAMKNSSLEFRFLWGVAYRSIFHKSTQLQRVFSNKVRIFTDVLCFQGLLFSLHWPDASLNSTLLRITCLVLSDISGFQTLPGGSRYRAWKWPWAKANHGWHCRANLSSSSKLIHGNLLFFCLWINEAQYAGKN